MTVTKQKQGTWKVDVSDGFNPLTGQQKRHRKKGIRTKKEAEEYEANYRLNILRQVKVKDRISVEMLYSLVQEEDELRGNSQDTKDTQKSYYKQYVSKFFKNADMKLIGANEIKEFSRLVSFTTKCERWQSFSYFGKSTNDFRS